MIKDLILKNRTYRRYDENEKIDIKKIEKWLDNARFSSCGNNMQALKYIVSLKKETNEKIFMGLKWAAALKNWDGPQAGERPVAYIIMLLDHNIRKTAMWDHGIAATNILLSAVEDGYGGCMLASFNKYQLVSELNIEEHLEPIMVIALGKPKETVVLEDMKNESYTYYRTEDGVHHVPKRPLKEIIYKEIF